MQYNFDEHINRKNTNCLKFDFAVERGKKEDILPFWVADMDFRGPNEVIEKLVERCQHGIFGYSEVKDDYNNAVTGWFKEYFNCNLKNEWIVKTPGVVYAIYTAINAFTNVGDSVLIQKPVYYPFSLAITDNDRKLINSPLVYENGKYKIDFVDFENKIVENNVKLFILCSPHNPVGRVYSKEELQKIGDICLKHDVIVVSDEIHCDFARKGYQHNVFLSVDKRFENNTILLTATSKTFNMAGLQVSNIFIPNEDLRNKFKRQIDKTGYSQLNTMGLVATKTAYEFGGQWLKELKEYLEGNLLFAKNFLEEKLPKIKLVEPEGTYLIWLDFSETGLSHNEVEDLIVDKANLWLDSGTMFGLEEGENFQRINIATQREFLQQCLENLYTTFKEY